MTRQLLKTSSEAVTQNQWRGGRTWTRRAEEVEKAEDLVHILKGMSILFVQELDMGYERKRSQF